MKFKRLYTDAIYSYENAVHYIFSPGDEPEQRFARIEFVLQQLLLNLNLTDEQKSMLLVNEFLPDA